MSIQGKDPMLPPTGAHRAKTDNLRGQPKLSLELLRTTVYSNSSCTNARFFKPLVVGSSPTPVSLNGGLAVILWDTFGTLGRMDRRRYTM